MLEVLLVLALLAVLVLGVTLYFALRRDDARAAVAAVQAAQRELAAGGERLERELREAIATSARDVRTETGTRLVDMQAALLQQTSQLATLQGGQLAGFGQQVQKIAEVTEQAGRANREESARKLQDFGVLMQQQLAELTRSLQLNLAEVRGTLQAQLAALQQGNESKLDQMRATVEEKLQSTLEARLGESFRQVSERLEQVHKGLGEMQTLAAGVGDLKRVLTNVKTRGGFGEVQLGALLEQVLTPEQYAANVAPRPGSGERVEFAIRLPGRDAPCWLPIDAKFPVEDYERLHAAQERADLAAVEEAGRALEGRIKTEARRIREKYIEAPHTTDFALLFLPTEGLYAEVLRRPGLVEGLQREQRVVIAGPTTLAAMLNSLQMGFRTLALERRSAEVWQVLGAVKTEFGKFGEVLARLKDQLQTASNTIEKAETRTRQMDRALKGVEALPAEQAAQLLPPAPPAS
ncbi:MAG: DNA recombination protein RmuC [Burkholderiales bacterium]|nr:DNA recombination protein RmuC [Burkholderiales bacterium]